MTPDKIVKCGPNQGMDFVDEAKRLENKGDHAGAAEQYEKAKKCFLGSITYQELYGKCLVAENINILKYQLDGRIVETLVHDTDVQCARPVEEYIKTTVLDDVKKYRILLDFYREMQDIYSNKDEKKVSEYYYKEKKLLSKYFWSLMKSPNNKWYGRIRDFFLVVFSEIFHLYCGYGEKTPRAAGISTATIFVFAGIYYFGNMLSFTGNSKIDTPIDFVQSLYFSIISVTTLGYGDIAPCTNIGRIVASLEVLLGYLMLSALVAILMRKIRR